VIGWRGGVAAAAMVVTFFSWHVWLPATGCHRHNCCAMLQFAPCYSKRWKRSDSAASKTSATTCGSPQHGMARYGGEPNRPLKIKGYRRSAVRRKHC
jgi:hypothetical protein